jgi:transcription elongation factor GreA
MSGKPITLTKEGYNELMEKLTYLKGPKRMEIADALDKARSLGDLSENAEYDAAKNEQAHMERQINELEDVLTRARIMDDTHMAKDEALVGAFVMLRDLADGEEFEYMLVSGEEADFEKNKISVESPVGRALLGHKVGDQVDITAPAAVMRYEIIGIRR